MHCSADNDDDDDDDDADDDVEAVATDADVVAVNERMMCGSAAAKTAGCAHRRTKSRVAAAGKREGERRCFEARDKKRHGYTVQVKNKTNTLRRGNLIWIP